jgi:hypothetical protein
VKVYVKGEPEVSLTKTHFVAEGGEGKVYARGKTGYKIYHDPGKAIPVGKIQELSGITDPCVIKPEAALYKGKKGLHVGHTFTFVKDTWTLCQLFPRAFREREGFDHDMAIKLVRKIQAGVDAVHKGGVLIVDLNEMNFLVSKDFTNPYFIDVDSYQTVHYPATAIMPSIRDPQVAGVDFTSLSDWFSFGIVSFQLLVGIHPFKGKHPSIKGLEARMKAGASVFDNAVKVPKVAYDLDVIPGVYRDWYESLFVRGNREAPPADLTSVIIVRPTMRKVSGTNNFDIKELHEFAENIRAVFLGGGHVVVYAGQDLYMDKRDWGKWGQQAPKIGFTAKHGHPMAAVTNPSDGILRLLNLVTKEIPGLVIHADELMAYGETLYIRNRDQILEITFTEAGNKTIAGTRLAANVLENASRLYEGVVIQSLLGDPHVSIFPQPGLCYQKMVPELKGHKIVQAKFDGGVLMVLAAEGGTYHRYVFRFDKDYAKYDVRKVEDVAATDLNFVTLDSGTCVCLNEDEELELFSNRMGSKTVKTIDDPVLGGDMRLIKNHGQMQFYRGNKLYEMRMK